MRYGLDRPTMPETRRCHWCGNSLRYIVNPWKGKDCERWYCGKEHHQLGESQALSKKMKAAGMVSSHYLISGLVLAVLMLAFIFGGGHKAFAHDPQTHQADGLANARSDAYGVCCNGDDYSKIRIEEWETTETGYRVFYKGQWLEGSRSVKVNNMQNPDGEAKAWIYYADGKPYLRCFMAGSMG